MQDALSLVSALRRPKLLIRAARHGQDDYRRHSSLGRILNHGRLPGPAQAVILLLEKEAEMNEARETGLASYSLVQHVEILIALMGEARLLRQSVGRA